MIKHKLFFLFLLVLPVPLKFLGRAVAVAFMIDKICRALLTSVVCGAYAHLGLGGHVGIALGVTQPSFGLFSIAAQFSLLM